MKSLMVLILLTLTPPLALASTEAFMVWQVTNATGSASDWQRLEFDVGVGSVSFSLHGAVIFPGNRTALTGTCVYESAALIRCKANATLSGVEMLIDLTGPELKLDFTTTSYSVFGTAQGSGSAVPLVIGSLN